MTNYIKQWWERTKAKNQADNISRLRDSFYLKEKNGNVWIMHNGDAVFKIPSFASSEETVAYLEESRGYAIECAFGIPYVQKQGKRHIWGNATAIGDIAPTYIDKNIDPNFFVDIDL